jgi:hypothetical protein
VKKIKINIEKLFLIIFIVVLISFSIYFVTPSSDNYYHYNVAKYILKDPSFLWKTNQTGFARMLSTEQRGFFNYPPLTHIIFAILIMLQLPTFLLTVLAILAIGYFMYKKEALAIPFLLISFLFVRTMSFEENDIFVTALTLGAIYFFEKKPIISGIFIGLTALIKLTGVFVLFFYLISVLVLKRKEIFNKTIYKNKYFLSIIVAFLVLSPWYARNFILFKGNLEATISGGQTLGQIVGGQNFLIQGFQASQPEMHWWDSSGYYPLPIDLLFYLGLIFTAFNIYKKRRVAIEEIFIISFSGMYFFVQATGTLFLMTIRYYSPIFPLLAIQIKKGLSEKYLKYSYIICFILFIYFALNLSRYAFNQYSDLISPACEQIKSAIDSESVYVNAFHNWFVTYKCDLNATTQTDSKWTLDFDKGQLYPTNHTNITGA